jgi:hypothetical protein
MDRGSIAATVIVAESVAVAVTSAAAAEAVSVAISAAAEQHDDYEDNPKTVIVAEKHVNFPPLNGFNPYYEKNRKSVTCFIAAIKKRKGGQY